MRQLITLISSGDLAQYPNNSLTQFTNSFPEALSPKLSMFFRLRLRSIAISKHLKKPDPYSSVVKVFLKETETQAAGGLFESCLGSFDTTHAEEHGPYYFFEFENTPFVKIARSPLASLSVFVTNAINLQLELDESYPSFLLVEVTDERMPNQFQITCYSHLHSDTEEQLFPNNTLEDFMVSLPNELELSNRWEMALASISFPSLMMDANLYMVVAGQTIYFPPRNYKSVEGMLKHIKRRFQGFYNAQEVTMRLSKNKSGWLNGLKFVRLNAQEREEETQRGGPPRDLDDDDEEEDTEEMRRLDETRRIMHHEHSFTSEALPIRISVGLMHMLGHRYRTTDYGFILKFGRQNRVFVPRLPKKKVDYMNSVRPTPLSLLYCDIVRHSIVGDEKGALLQLIPVEDFFGKESAVQYVPRQLIFHPIVPYKIKNIRFQMFQTDGTKNSFVSDINQSKQGSMIITLLFRHKKKE
jgi:hypothetical protein